MKFLFFSCFFVVDFLLTFCSFIVVLLIIFSGFIPKNKINRAQFLNGADIVLPQENENVAATTMSALVHAMEENQVYAIARYVIKKDKGPKVVCLSPHIERTPDGRLLECMVRNDMII